MDLRKSLHKTVNLKVINTIVQSILENPNNFNLLYELMSDKDAKICWRAAWVCDKIAEIRPEFFSQAQIEEIVSCTITNSHQG